MNTNKAAYWISLGVLALGLNSEYRHGNFVTLHRVAEHTGSLLCRFSVRAEQALASARVLRVREELPADTLLASTATADLVRDQAELVREQTREQAELMRERVREQMLTQRDLIRAQAEMQRAAMEEMRDRVRTQMGLVRVVNGRMKVDCPKVKTQVVVDGMSDLADISSDVDVEVDDNL